MSVVASYLRTPIPFVKNAWQYADLPKGVITEIDLRVRLNVSGGSSVSPAADAPYSIIKALNVVRGSDYLIQTDGYKLFVKGYYEYSGAVKQDTLPAANATKDVVFELVIHPGYFPERKDDTSVVIDNRNGDVRLQVLWGSESDLGSGYTINGGEIYVTAWLLGAAPSRIREPSWEIATKTIDRTYSDLGLEVDLPKGKYTPKAIIVVRDSGGARSDSVVSELGLKDKRYGGVRIVHRVLYEQQKYDDMRRYTVATPITGVVIFDASEIGLANIYGVEDVVLGFTTTATGSLELLFPSHR